MKSRVGLGQIYGDLARAPDVSPPEHAVKSNEDTPTPEPAPPSELVSLTVHVEKSDLDELLRKVPQGG